MVKVLFVCTAKKGCEGQQAKSILQKAETYPCLCMTITKKVVIPRKKGVFNIIFAIFMYFIFLLIRKSLLSSSMFLPNGLPPRVQCC
jgi:hypothetical protein